MPKDRNLPAFLANSANDQIIRPRSLPAVVGVSRTTIWRLERELNSNFPKRVKLSAGAVGYRMSEVQAWLEVRQSA